MIINSILAIFIKFVVQPYISKWALAGWQRILASDLRFFISNNANISKFDTVIDVGAHEAAFTKTIRLHNDSCKIYSFEPDPLNFKCLEKNTESLKNVSIYPKAVSDKNGEVHMRLIEDASWNSKLSIAVKGL